MAAHSSFERVLHLRVCTLLEALAEEQRDADQQEREEEGVAGRQAEAEAAREVGGDRACGSRHTCRSAGCSAGVPAGFSGASIM